VPPRDGAAALMFEAVNVPRVMSPWELREHLAFLIDESQPAPALGPIQQASGRFTRNWQALWARYGEDRGGWPDYRRLLDVFVEEVTPHARTVTLRNGNPLLPALNGIVVLSALSDRAAIADAETRNPAQALAGGAS